ncbi:hypothetical protein C9988_04215, partial [Pseudidiomarina aestuarii]
QINLFYEDAGSLNLSAAGTIQDFYDSYLNLTEDSSNPLFIDGRLYGQFTGHEDWGIDGMLAGIYLELGQLAQTELVRYWIQIGLVNTYCWRSFPCDFIDANY